MVSHPQRGEWEGSLETVREVAYLGQKQKLSLGLERTQLIWEEIPGGMEEECGGGPGRKSR